MNEMTVPSSPNSKLALYQKPDDDCPICLETFAGRKVMVLEKCKHMFHKACLEPWLSENSTCPSCKTFLATREVQVFLYSVSDRAINQARALSSSLSATTRVTGDSHTDSQSSDRQNWEDRAFASAWLEAGSSRASASFAAILGRGTSGSSPDNSKT
ncbi:RING-H2 finger protein [Endozoicomonas sp. SESOKO2]|uniref:RING-H2 finger protein n=1 Tax=Endozoicomonas sp. SESOKO2 TaxID=2828743 RepID=UPI00214746B6|nr:RING-H2 finger protein [Endozoicomonas sp. SESOKO2]